MEELVCESSSGSPTWGVFNVLRWKAWPERLGGGRAYIQQWKDAWVRHNKSQIRAVALRHGFPAEVLAGVCWIEAGGDPMLIDRVAFEVRSFDWSGPGWMDRNMTITHTPGRTSFGAVSMQLRTAAQTLGMTSDLLAFEQPIDRPGLFLAVSHNSACNDPWLRGQLAKKMTELPASGLTEAALQRNIERWKAQQHQPPQPVSAPKQ